MASLLQQTPIRQESRATCRARMERDLNAGRDPEHANFYDVIPGNPISDLLETAAMEAERLWDMGSIDIIAASTIEFAYGPYLDAHAAETDIQRGGAVASTGELTFTGDNGTIIGIGTEASTIQAAFDEEPVAFRTTEGGTISGGSLTLAAVAVEEGTEGNVASGSVIDLLTDVDGITAVTNAHAMTSGEDIETDESFRERLKLAHSASHGGGSLDDLAAWALEYPGVGNVRVVGLWNGAGTARVIVTDVDNNPVSAAVEDGLQARLDPVSARTLTNHASFTLPGGSPAGTIVVDSTTGFSPLGRIYVGTQLVTYTGLTSTTFTGISGGTGSVPDNTEVIQHGEGRGLAAPGSMITVDTAAILAVSVEADITPADGYSINGAAGTIDLSDEVEAAIREYIDSLPPGGEDAPGPETPAGSGSIQRIRVASKIMEVDGVYTVNLTTMELNNATSDLAVAALQVPEVSTVTLS